MSYLVECRPCSIGRLIVCKSAFRPFDRVKPGLPAVFLHVWIGCMCMLYPIQGEVNSLRIIRVLCLVLLRSISRAMVEMTCAGGGGERGIYEYQRKATPRMVEWGYCLYVVSHCVVSTCVFCSCVISQCTLCASELFICSCSIDNILVLHISVHVYK